MPERPTCDQRARLGKVNQTLRIIASHGRRFFSQDADRVERMENPRISQFEFAPNGRLWYIDKWRGSRIFVHYEPRRARGGLGWRFSDGGTLESLVKAMRDYILKGDLGFLRHFGPWREWVCGGDLWGYGDAMAQVRNEISALFPEHTPREEAK